MKKNKFMLLLLVSMVSFCFGVNYIKAADLPMCDFENNYGTVKPSVKPNVEIGDTNYGLTRISYWCFDSEGVPIGAFDKSTCVNPSEKFYIQFNVSKRISNKDGYVKSAKFTIYNNNGDAQCYIEPEISGEYGVYQFNFNLNKKEVSKIVAEGTYFNGDEVKSFGSDTFNINHKGDGSGSEHTTIAGTTPTTLKEGVIGGGGAAAGIGKATATKSKVDTAINGETACNSINDIFDYFWPYVMIIIPILLILMMSLDFFKCMISNDADAIKKAGTGAVKRTIAAVVLLALPVILRYIFELFGLDFCL